MSPTNPMLEFVLIVGSFLGYRYAVSKGWMQPLPLLGGAPDVVVAEIETYMPDAQRTSVLAALVNETDPMQLIALASSFTQYFPMAAYSLQLRAWTLSGKQGPQPQMPSDVTMAAAQAAWAASQVIPGGSSS